MMFLMLDLMKPISMYTLRPHNLQCPQDIGEIIERYLKSPVLGDTGLFYEEFCSVATVIYLWSFNKAHVDACLWGNNADN